jgi:gluconolactonase
MNRQGNLASAHNGLGTAWLVDRLGEPLLRIRSPAGLAITNLAFHPTEAARLVMTESETGSVLVADVAGSGRPQCSLQFADRAAGRGQDGTGEP